MEAVGIAGLYGYLLLSVKSQKSSFCHSSAQTVLVNKFSKALGFVGLMRRGLAGVAWGAVVF